jgi:hypothetical protein
VQKKRGKALSLGCDADPQVVRQKEKEGVKGESKEDVKY